MTNLEKAARALAGVYFADVDAKHEVDKFKPPGDQEPIWMKYRTAVAPVLTAFAIDPDGTYVEP